jgi:type III secretory pathway component EscS
MEYKLGRFTDLDLSAVPSALVGSIVLWTAVCGLAISLLQFPIKQVLVAGLFATILHWLGETVHQLGHAAFARRTGHPMIGIRYWGMLSTSVYPPDEPTLPATIHIRRALGGPVASLIAASAAGLFFLALNAVITNGIVWWLALYLFLENTLVFCLGALLPLGFTDGSTLLYWWKRK